MFKPKGTWGSIFVWLNILVIKEFLVMGLVD